MICEFLTDGFEEMEAIVPLDLLRRAGVDVCTAGVWLKPGSGKTVTGSHGIPVTCDIAMDQVDGEALEGVILPGGPGHARLAESGALLELVAFAARRGKLLAAICAAPSILGKNGYLKGKRACCYPGYEKDLLGAQVVRDPVVRHGNVITSRGAGTAVFFALAMIRYLASPEKAEEIAAQVQCP
jgi:4-methyl-5(b-hydroxyethyl)-thiazole monophosphate biosynthesis